MADGKVTVRVTAEADVTTWAFAGALSEVNVSAQQQAQFINAFYEGLKVAVNAEIGAPLMNERIANIAQHLTPNGKRFVASLAWFAKDAP